MSDKAEGKQREIYSEAKLKLLGENFAVCLCACMFVKLAKGKYSPATFLGEQTKN